MFALVAASNIEARHAMIRLEREGVFDPAHREMSKQEVCIVTPHSPDTVRGIAFEGGVFVDGWCRSIGVAQKHEILQQLELSGLRDCDILYVR